MLPLCRRTLCKCWIHKKGINGPILHDFIKREPHLKGEGDQECELWNKYSTLILSSSADRPAISSREWSPFESQSSSSALTESESS
jgi:hypothetical protein